MEIKDSSHDEQFFEIISIERSDDGNFEAVLEVSESGENGPGITEKYIKCLEEEIKKDRSKDENFSTAVLKFQEAVEQYSKSICERLPRCMLDDECVEKKVQQIKNEPEVNESHISYGHRSDKGCSVNPIEKALEMKDIQKSTYDKRQSNHKTLKEFALLLTGFIFLIWYLFPESDIFFGNYDDESIYNIMDGYVELTKLSDVPLRK